MLTGAPFFERSDMTGRRYLTIKGSEDGEEQKAEEPEETIDLSRSTVEALVKRCSLG